MPIWPWNLVARTTSSRRVPARALPTMISDSPCEYTSAVSMKLIPASSARWMTEMDVSWSRSPQAPNIIAPRHSGLTWMPVPPRPRYLMAELPCWRLPERDHSYVASHLISTGLKAAHREKHTVRFTRGPSYSACPGWQALGVQERVEHVERLGVDVDLTVPQALLPPQAAGLAGDPCPGGSQLGEESVSRVQGLVPVTDEPRLVGEVERTEVGRLGEHGPSFVLSGAAGDAGGDHQLEHECESVAPVPAEGQDPAPAGVGLDRTVRVRRRRSVGVDRHTLGKRLAGFAQAQDLVEGNRGGRHVQDERRARAAG